MHVFYGSSHRVYNNKVQRNPNGVIYYERFFLPLGVCADCAAGGHSLSDSYQQYSCSLYSLLSPSLRDILVISHPFPPPSVLNAVHSLSLIGECEFCHHLINVQDSARSGSSAPLGTSVHAHPCSHRGVRRRKTHTHTHIGPYAHARYCHFGY